MTQALYAHINNKRKKKDVMSSFSVQYKYQFRKFCMALYVSSEHEKYDD
jgi:hypothetical protein